MIAAPAARRIALVVWAGLVTPAASSLALELRAVAVAGATAPGSSDEFVGFTPPALNSGGQVAFEGLLGPAGGPFFNAIFSEGDGVGALREVVREGDAAPGAPGRSFVEFEQTDGNLYFNNLGDVAFIGAVNGGDRGLWTDRQRPDVPLTKIAFAGDVAPGAEGSRNFQSAFAFRGFGDIHSGAAFFSILTVSPTPPDNFPSSAVFSEGFAVVLDKVAQTGYDLAPGAMTGGGVTTRFSEVFAPTINDAGHVAFAGKSIGGGTVVGQAGVWTTSPAGTLRPVGLQGLAAPGTSTTFSQIFRDSPVINHAGDVAFMATLNGLIAGNIREGVWVERDGVVTKTAIESDPAPGTSATFGDMRDALIDEQGHVVFVAQLEEPSSRDGLWRETAPGALAKVALQGEPAPGTALNYLNILDVAVNATGQVAFKAQLSDFGTTAVFATDAAGVVQKVLAQGDAVMIDGDVMTANFLDFRGMNGGIAQSGLASGFNDAGQVALVVGFNPSELHPDGLLGVFVAEPPTAPSADFDGDHDADGADFLAWQRGFGGDGAAEGNANGDDVVDGADLAIWRGQFGQTGLPASAVPEPAGGALAAAAAVGAGLRRGSRRAAGPRRQVG